MRRKLSLVDYILILIGLISAWLGVRTMLEIPMFILSRWLLVLLYGSILLAVSLILGVLISSLTKSKIHLLSAASIILTVVCLTFYISEYRPTYKINVTKNFVGEVKLFNSTLDNNKLDLNEYGVGYITNNTYRKGFRPIVYKNGKDITKECKAIIVSSVASVGVDGTNIGPYSYIGFTIGDKTNDSIWTDLRKAIDLKVFDTSIVVKQ